MLLILWFIKLTALSNGWADPKQQVVGKNWKPKVKTPKNLCIFFLSSVIDLWNIVDEFFLLLQSTCGNSEKEREREGERDHQQRSVTKFGQTTKQFSWLHCTVYNFLHIILSRWSEPVGFLTRFLQEQLHAREPSCCNYVHKSFSLSSRRPFLHTSLHPRNVYLPIKKNNNSYDRTQT